MFLVEVGHLPDRALELLTSAALAQCEEPLYAAMADALTDEGARRLRRRVGEDAGPVVMRVPLLDPIQAAAGWREMFRGCFALETTQLTCVDPEEINILDAAARFLHDVGIACARQYRAARAAVQGPPN
jgi:hypothetical protein